MSPTTSTAASLTPPWPDGTQTAIFGLGCFWGAEKDFWTQPGVVSTAVGYAGGFTLNPTYEEVCSGQTGHAEVVLVVYDPARVTLRGAAAGLLGAPRPHAGHAPGQRPGHAVPLGDLRPVAESSRPRPKPRASRTRRSSRGRATAPITTEIAPAGPFYYAEPYHQQYLSQEPQRLLPRPFDRGLLPGGTRGRLPPADQAAAVP